MAIQAIATALVHKNPPNKVTYEGQEYNSYRVIHAGLKDPCKINLLVVPGSINDNALSIFQKDVAKAAASSQKMSVRLLIQGTNGTLNVTSEVRAGGAIAADGKGLLDGVVHAADTLDLICTSVRQTVLDPQAEPEQFTVTMIANCEIDSFSSTIKVGDGLQDPLQPGQNDALHIRLLPENPLVKQVLHGIGDPKKDDHIQPAAGIYFLSGSLVRESKAAQPAQLDAHGGIKKKAFVAWDRMAMQVTSAFPIKIQDMSAQKESNKTVALHRPDPNYFDNVTSGKTESSYMSFGKEVDDLMY